MFPYGDTGCRLPAPTNYVFKGPMDSAGLPLYDPTTGESPRLGLLTDASAEFMLGGSPNAMLAWAQVAGSRPMHFVDETTGQCIDLTKYPQANAADIEGRQGQPWLDKGPPTPTSNGYHQYGGGWTPQQAHEPSLSYLAHVATGDPVFLRDLQHSANFMVLTDASKSTPKAAIISGELRGVSWGLRELFGAHVATQDAEALGPLHPSLKPSSYFKKLLDNALTYYGLLMIDPAQSVFHLVGGGTRFAPWQVDYNLSALAFGVLTGHSDWVPLYLWAFKNVYDRTSGKSGYPVGWGGAYYLNTCEWGKNADDTYNQGIFDASKPLDWAGTFLFQGNDPNGAQPTPAQIASLKADQFNAANGYKPFVGAEYLMTTRAVLVMARYLHKLGLVDVKAVYPDLDLCFANVDRMVRANGSMNPRVSVILNTQPPQGGLMPTSFSIAIGATEQLNLVLNGALTDGPIYTTDAPTIVSLEPNAAGVIVTGLAAGSAKITATGTGATELSAESDATVTLPLATSMELVPA